MIETSEGGKINYDWNIVDQYMIEKGSLCYYIDDFFTKHIPLHPLNEKFYPRLSEEIREGVNNYLEEHDEKIRNKNTIFEKIKNNKYEKNKNFKEDMNEYLLYGEHKRLLIDRKKIFSRFF